jgi:hypothetical protein
MAVPVTRSRPRAIRLSRKVGHKGLERLPADREGLGWSARYEGLRSAQAAVI